MPIALIPFLLLAVPIAEIACFVAVGREIGIGWTLALILVTAIIGTLLLRVQGFGLIARVRQEVGAGRVPARELVHGVMLLVAGVLLLTPGFITDALGFLLFVPPLRESVWRALRSKVTISAFGGMAGRAAGEGFGAPRRAREGVIDLDEDEYRRTDAGAEGRADPLTPDANDRAGSIPRDPHRSPRD